METSRMRLGVRRIWRRPGSSFRNSAAISNWIWAIRKGFKSSRGAMRGTIGGVPIGLAGAVGFATVAIGSGRFLKSVLNQKRVAKLLLREIFPSGYAFAASFREAPR